MGLSNSKIITETKEDSAEVVNVPSTPISTPQSPRKNDVIDPRSPSTHISRTPVELDYFTMEENDDIFYSPMKDNIFKYGIDPRSPTTAFLRTPIVLNDSKNNLLLNSSDDNIEIYGSPPGIETTVLGIDPRSPTNDFVRTPIIVENCSSDKLIKILHNKNLEKVIKSEIWTTPANKQKPPGPKLLESSPIKPRTEAYKRKSFVGLLETNIDFTETDIDVVLKEKCRIKGNDEIVVENNAINLQESEDFELNHVVNLIVNESKENCDDINQNDDIKEEVTSDPNNVQEYIKTVHEMSQEVKSAPLTPRINITDSKYLIESKSAPVTPPLINITADVKELDKKLTNLIYEDQDIVVCPRIVQLKDVLERSPLRNRNGHELETKKSAQKLKVSDKPRKSDFGDKSRKSDFAVSKIPVFKTKTKIQCENTPPRSVEKKAKIGKKSLWDSNDVTLYL